MMKINALPKEVVAELLNFIADTEPFEETGKILGDSVEIGDLRRALREIGQALRREAASEKEKNLPFDSKSNGYLSPEAERLLSCLTPREERIVLKTFGFLDKG
ncbi:MAG: hypothetical protein HYS22_06995 [Deltaproteobacteria bacterium]|nr:hypothetical protein [Deltaproteobacteria bacterium]